MHVLIINGSPRIKKYSNTDKILEKLTEGMTEAGATFEQYEVSDRKQWDDIRSAYRKNKNILIALPLFVECVPGLLLEFLETLPQKKDGTGMAFLLQSGFAEGVQLRCGEAFLENLALELGCEYNGTLVKGSNFSIRFSEGKQRDSITEPYKKMGALFAENGSFMSAECRNFTGPEIFSAPIRLLIDTLQKTIGKSTIKKIARNWGCKVPVEHRPYK